MITNKRPLLPYKTPETLECSGFPGFLCVSGDIEGYVQQDEYEW